MSGPSPGNPLITLYSLRSAIDDILIIKQLKAKRGKKQQIMFYLPSEVPFSQSQSYSIHPAGDDDDSKPEPEDNRPRQRVIIDTAILDTTPAEVIDIAHKRALALVDSLLAAEKGKVLREIEEWLE
ncbi:MAG: hypothetical protein EZS28_044667, partial [Streblomastix strix]